MIINNFEGFIGEHCETTATGSLLKQIGVSLSEPMLFGIGEGLGFIFWKMKVINFPFIGGRVKTDLLTENICKNLSLKLEVKECYLSFKVIAKQWKQVSDLFFKAGETENIEYIEEASLILIDIAQKEKTEMEKLRNLTLQFS